MMTFMGLRFIKSNKRYFHSSFVSLLKNTWFSENLSERSLTQVKGNEIVPFMQGLITNDMNHLQQKNTNAIYAMFLNKSGRVLHDSIIYKTPDPNTFIIETDKKGSDDLRRHLRLFRVRRKIDIDNIDSEFSIWVIFQSLNEANDIVEDRESNELNISGNLKSTEIIISLDPRVKALGMRLILPKSMVIKDLTNTFQTIDLQLSTSDNDYKLHRYKLGVSEGIAEHHYNKILPFETNIDYLHGISFHKGCYLGQELTARTYHTGVIRKRILPIRLNKALETDESLEVRMLNGTSCGIVRGIKNNRCIATIRIDRALQEKHLLINNEECKLIVPHWWPKELPKLKETKQV